MSAFCNTCGDFHMEKTGIYIYIYIYIHIYMVYTAEGFFEVATESWPQWNLNPQPLNCIQTL